ncbi:myo-inositol-1(or 4)-monophosphatase [Halogranum amylolyticum]|uniref:fructose-bisphosphatase n=1 Tax=Halogranum amylolyticum TaxID=660520 RepID=A0A1H8S2R0_9EURY|nr:inositol monophosphatase [Halogranum amylolyticum]SEO72714.1 myo-inositol-1(or 4)-monophosphatase [Halogranum amylolyticum]
MTDGTDRATVAERAAASGADVAAAAFRQGIAVETKEGKTDVVTQADRDTQARVIEVIAESFPDDVVVGEEADARKTVPNEGHSWVVDPIDGTNNFVRNIRVWTTSVAAVDDGEPVAAANVLPACDDAYTADAEGTYRNGTPVSVSDVSDPRRATVAPTFWWDFDHRAEYAAATRGIVERFGDLRRFGSAQVTLSMVASGALEGTITNERANPWDTVAGVYMVRQAGGTVTDLEGDRWRHDSTGLVASNGAVHDEVLAAAQAIEGSDD